MKAMDLISEARSMLRDNKSAVSIGIFAFIGVLIQSVKGVRLLSVVFGIVGYVFLIYAMKMAYVMVMENKSVSKSDVKINSKMIINLVLFELAKGFIIFLVPMIVLIFLSYILLSAVESIAGAYVAMIIFAIVAIVALTILSAFVETMYSLVPSIMFYDNSIGLGKAMSLSSVSMHKYFKPMFIVIIIQMILFVPAYGYLITNGIGQMGDILNGLNDSSGFTIDLGTVFKALMGMLAYPIVYTIQTKIFKKALEEDDILRNVDKI